MRNISGFIPVSAGPHLTKWHGKMVPQIRYIGTISCGLQEQNKWNGIRNCGWEWKKFKTIHIRKIFLENLCEQCIVSINPNRTRFGLSVKYTPDEFWWCQWCRFVCIYICTHEADVYVCLSIRRLNGMHLNKSHVNQHLIPHTKRVCSLLTYVFVLEVVMRTHAHNLPQTISFLHLCA